MKLRLWLFIAVWGFLKLQAVTQAAPASSVSVSVPPIIQFSNVASDEGGTPLTGTVSITFSLYNTAVGGQPLWCETQNVQLGSGGQYSVYLGLTQTNGLPTNLFTSGQAQWLGVKISGQPEQPRVYLVSVPYAMKAGDAATIGGLPPSAFVMAAAGSGSSTAVAAASDAGAAGGSSVSPNGAITGSGTVDYVPLWDTASDIISSILYQSGSGATAKIGINNATPAATLDVKGTANLRGTTTVMGMLVLPTTGAATSSAGKNSEPITQAASAYNSSTGAAVNQTFEWLAEPANNDTSTASGTLNLLFGQGAAKPAETGLHIATNGQITFAAGQTFPGTGSGTVTSVGSGTGLTGGPITNSGTLQIDPTVVPELNAASNTFTGSIGASSFTGNGAGLTNVNAATLNGLTSSAFAPAGTYATLGANTFSATQTISTGDLALSTGNLDLSATGAIKLGGIPFAFGTPYSFSNGSNSGADAFLGFAGNSTSTGSFNTAVGNFALEADSTGANNVAVGYSSLLQNTTGSSNTAVGDIAGITADNSAMTGSNNTFLGSSALASTGTLSNATAIGFTAEVAESNALVLGGTGTNAVDVGIGTTKPLARLTISGSETTANGSGAGIQLTNTASGGMDYYFRVGATGTNTGAGNMSIANDDEYIMTFTPPGNIGILNQSPSYTLDVNGTGRFTGTVNFAAGQTFPNTISSVTAGPGLSETGSGNITLTNIGILSLAAGTGISSSGGQSPTISINTSVVPELGAANTFTATQRINGNLGINEAPTWPLQVSGSGGTTAQFDNTSQTSRLRLNGALDTGGDLIYQANGTSLFGVYSIAANTLGFYPSDGSTASMFIDGSSVGIGTMAPIYPLDVQAGTPGTSGTAWAAFVGGNSAASGSQDKGVNGLEVEGGNGDSNVGGYAIEAYGGDGATGGNGIEGTGGNGTSTDGIGGVFNGGTTSVNGDGVYVFGGTGYMGYFDGNVEITGTLNGGSPRARIDHPLDPANKYLVHASVGSSEMMNMYSGNVTTDAHGVATVQLPEWFEALNTDFRYQLTVIGQFAQAIVSREIQNHQFEVRTSLPSVKVSWQVTGVRQDAYAKAHPLVVEEEKETRLRGFYVHPELYGAPAEKQIQWARHPQMMQQIREHGAKQAAGRTAAFAQRVRTQNEPPAAARPTQVGAPAKPSATAKPALARPAASKPTSNASSASR